MPKTVGYSFFLIKFAARKIISGSGMSKECQKIDIDKRAHLRVKLRWHGKVDLDLSAFMLNKDGYIDNESDFVFYNSTNRSESFDSERYVSEEDWISKTVPISADSSLVGATDAEGVVDGSSVETMSLNLLNVNENVCRIVFCVSIFQSGLHGGRDDMQLSSDISLIDSDTGDVLSSFALDELGVSATSAETYDLERTPDNGWVCRLCNVTHDGGLRSIIDKYV